MVGRIPSARPLALVLAAIAIACTALPVEVRALPAGSDRVEARLEVHLESPAGGRMEGNFSLFSYTLNGTTSTADQLRERLLSPEGENFRSLLENSTVQMFSDSFGELFPKDRLAGVSCTLDASSLEDSAGTDEFNPPLVLRTAGKVQIAPEGFGLPPVTDLDRLAPLVLADGAGLHRELVLEAPPGHGVELSLETFAGTVISETGQREVRLALDNANGTEPAGLSRGITLRSAAPAGPGEEELRIRGTVDLPDLYTVRIQGILEFCRADPRAYWTPPEGIRNLTVVSGAALSELTRSGILPLDDIYDRAVLPVQNALEPQLERLLNASLVFRPGWNISGNLSCILSAESAGHPLLSLPPQLVQGALKAGASYLFSVPVEVGWPSEIEFIPPDGMVLDGLQPAGGAPGRQRFLWSCPSGRGEIRASLSSSTPARYSTDEVSVTVAGYFSDPDLNLGNILTRRTAEVPVSVEARIRMGAVRLPSAISARLPSNLTLDYVTSDLIRLLLAEGYIGSGELDRILQELRPRMEAPLRAALGSGARPETRFLPQTLEGYNLTLMDGSRPVEVQARASGSRTKQLDLLKAVRASPGLARISQDFALKGVAGWCVTYRMSFAPELKLVAVEGDGAGLVRGSEGGSDYFEISFGPAGGAANVTAYLEPTPAFLFSVLGPQLCPCAVLLLAVTLPGLLALRKRMKRRGRHRELRDDEDGGKQAKYISGGPHSGQGARDGGE